MATHTKTPWCKKKHTHTAAWHATSETPFDTYHTPARYSCLRVSSTKTNKQAANNTIFSAGEQDCSLKKNRRRRVGGAEGGLVSLFLSPVLIPYILLRRTMSYALRQARNTNDPLPSVHNPIDNQRREEKKKHQQKSNLSKIITIKPPPSPPAHFRPLFVHSFSSHRRTRHGSPAAHKLPKSDPLEMKHFFSRWIQSKFQFQIKVKFWPMNKSIRYCCTMETQERAS